MVLDPHLHKVMPSITDGIKDGGIYIQNTVKEPNELINELNLKVKLSIVASVDATGLAMKYMGVAIPNIAMLGAFARVTGLITLDSAKKAIKAKFPERVWDSYIKCLEAGYKEVRIKVM